MIFNIINFIRSLSKEDYDRFIRYLNEARDYPYFSTLYDMDDFNKDTEYFNNLHVKTIVSFNKEEKKNDTK